MKMTFRISLTPEQRNQLTERAARDNTSPTRIAEAGLHFYLSNPQLRVITQTTSQIIDLGIEGNKTQAA